MRQEPQSDMYVAKSISVFKKFSPASIIPPMLHTHLQLPTEKAGEA
jgi:hypothetical protein